MPLISFIIMILTFIAAAIYALVTNAPTWLVIFLILTSSCFCYVMILEYKSDKEDNDEK